PARARDAPGFAHRARPDRRRRGRRDGSSALGPRAARPHLGPLDGQRTRSGVLAATALARTAAGPRDLQPPTRRPAPRRADGRALGLGRSLAALLGREGFPRRLARKPNGG